MERYEHLIELLEKEKLNSDEQIELTSLLKDPELENYYKTYSKLKKALSKEKHISTEHLCEYVFYTSSRESADKNIVKKIPAIEQHLRECNVCRQELKNYNEEFLSLNNFISERIGNYSQESKRQTFIKDLFTSPAFRYVRLLSIIVICTGALYFSLLMSSEYFIPENKKLAILTERIDSYLTRGRVSEEFQKGLISLENRNYSAAIDYLKNDIANNGSDETIFYTHYIVGLIYLEKAQADILGLFPTFNEDEVSEGIRNLKESVYKNNTGEFKNIQYDAYFFIGKAYLMRNNISEAKKYFNLVVSFKGSKIDEAREILSKL